MAFRLVSSSSFLEGAASLMTTIALDARLTRRLSVGMKTYVRELVARLPSAAPEYSFLPLDRGGNFGFDEQVRLPLQIARSRVALTHYLSLYVPIIRRKPYVVTIHDLIHLRLPEMHKRAVGPYYRTLVRAACAGAARVIVDDERTIDDLVELLGVDPRKMRVIALGVEERYLQHVQARVAARPYLLCVGNHREHKNLATLFEAWSSLPDDVALDLYLTGPDDFAGELQRRSREHRRIAALGDLAAGELAKAYAGAQALVHPALLEGFGLPMLEAMAVGTPVIASDTAVPRILADCALCFAARDAARLRTHILHVIDDAGLRTRLRESGQAMARRLTWDRCAKQTAEVYREVLEA